MNKILRHGDLPGRAALKRITRPAAKNTDRWTPLLFGGALIGLGAVLLKVKPRIGHVPNPTPFRDGKTAKRRHINARKARDTVKAFAPTNVTDQIGRSLVLGGAALLLTRLLDEASGRERR
ncbi:MAG: hypothetical protein ACU0CC_01310 [Sagittula sp.]|jgi:hypothetical protein|uniref:hypothetical protein n=1 Tax=Sagittula sp. TaxID=2038081 RepID=UPI0040585022